MVMKNKMYGCLLVCCMGTLLFAATGDQYQKAQDVLNERGEVYFKFNVHSRPDVKKQELYNDVSIDYIEYDPTRGCDVFFCYANKNEFEKFSKRGYAYEILTAPGQGFPGFMPAYYPWNNR